MSLEIKEILESLGYKLYDRGKFWQTNALFRDGDNKTAIQIYKDTGVWKDHVQDTNFMKFEVLVKKTLGTNNKLEIKKYLKGNTFNSLENRKEPSQRIEMEKTFDKDILKELLPHYKFYNDKGISNSVLKFFKSGFSTHGSMNKRFVFPIFNINDEIHGLAGRDMISQENRPKWKHVGKKSNWIYPAFLKNKDGKNIASIIEDCKEVILVESIGDLLSLHENGYKNVLVTFGLEISSALIYFLSSISLQKIILSFNNDGDKDENRGLNACIKNYLKLLKVFDCNLIKICLPTKNDFGEMSSDDYEAWNNKLNKVKELNQQSKIISLSNSLFKRGKLSQGIMNNIKYING